MTRKRPWPRGTGVPDGTGSRRKGDCRVIIYRVSGKARPRKIDEAREKFAALAAASRKVPGVVSFDIAQDVTDPAVFISTEVYQDQEAVDRQGELPELHDLMACLPELLADGPHGTIFDASATGSWPQ
jgi:quinol monooxygenase YgiN